MGHNVRNLKSIKNRVLFERNSKARKFCNFLKGRNVLNIIKKFCAVFRGNKSLKSIVVHTRDTV